MPQSAFERIGKMFWDEVARRGQTVVDQEVVSIEHFKCETARHRGVVQTRYLYDGGSFNVQPTYTAHENYLVIGWSAPLEYFKREMFRAHVKRQGIITDSIYRKIACKELYDLNKKRKEYQDKFNQNCQIIANEIKSKHEDGSNHENCFEIYNKIQEVESQINVQLNLNSEEMLKAKIRAGGICETFTAVENRYSVGSESRVSSVRNREHDPCSSYHFDAYVFFKDSTVPPWEFRADLPGMEHAWGQAPLNTYVIITRRQQPADQGGEVVYTPWKMEPACPATECELVEYLAGLVYIEPMALVYRTAPACRKPCCPWWIKLLLLLSLAGAMLVAVLLFFRLTAVELENRQLTGEVIRLEIRIEELREELVSAREALSELRRRADAAESALAAAEARVRELEAQIASLRARSGLDEPPCMRRTPQDQRPQPAYLFTVELHEAGIVVRPRAGALDELTAWRAPIRASDFDRPLSPAEFARLADPIYNISVERGCRYSVYVERGRHDSARSYQTQVDAVTDRFYIYEARR